MEFKSTRQPTKCLMRSWRRSEMMIWMKTPQPADGTPFKRGMRARIYRFALRVGALRTLSDPFTTRRECRRVQARGTRFGFALTSTVFRRVTNPNHAMPVRHRVSRQDAPNPMLETLWRWFWERRPRHRCLKAHGRPRLVFEHFLKRQTNGLEEFISNASRFSHGEPWKNPACRAPTAATPRAPLLRTCAPPQAWECCLRTATAWTQSC